jgi:AcrR family transcriptional regulator
MADDRRVRRTKRQLRDALMELVLEKGYDAVRVQDITDRADVGRATLYLHYRDKADLLLSCLQETVNELFALIQHNLADPASGELFQIAFAHAAENADLYRVLLSGQGTARHRIEVQGMIAGHAQSVLSRAFPGADPGDLEFCSVYTAGSLLMMIEWWLVNETPFSEETIAVMFRRVILQGVPGLLQ